MIFFSSLFRYFSYPTTTQKLSFYLIKRSKRKTNFKIQKLINLVESREEIVKNKIVIDLIVILIDREKGFFHINYKFKIFLIIILISL